MKEAEFLTQMPGNPICQPEVRAGRREDWLVTARIEQGSTGMLLVVCRNGGYMTASEFRQLWETQGDQLVVFSPASLQSVRIKEDSSKFLLVAGLPRDAAPFLSFDTTKAGPLPTVEDDWHLGPNYRCFRVIGFNGSGDPICLDENEEGAVVYLNHDNRFQRVPVNQSVPQLAESLLVFRQFIHDVNARLGEDAYIEGKIPPDLRLRLAEELQRIDQQAFHQNGFWTEVLATW
jgi:hypothetical protein